MKRILLMATMALFTFQSQAQSADDITGTWWTYHDDKKSGQVEVYKYKDSSAAVAVSSMWLTTKTPMAHLRSWITSILMSPSVQGLFKACVS